MAGFGTRFLPVTRAVPKNLLPVYDRPSIHFCVEEAAAAGIEEIIFVVSDNQEAIPRYFETWPELERGARKQGKLRDAGADAAHLEPCPDHLCDSG